MTQADHLQIIRTGRPKPPSEPTAAIGQRLCSTTTIPLPSTLKSQHCESGEDQMYPAAQRRPERAHNQCWSVKLSRRVRVPASVSGDLEAR